MRVGELYDCSNSIIIGDTFKYLDVPKSLIINVNNALNSSSAGQEIYDAEGGNIISGYYNRSYKSPYTLIIGKENFIQNNVSTTPLPSGMNIISGEDNQIWRGDPIIL